MTDKKENEEEKIVVPESVSKHIEEEYRKNPDFRRAYDKEILKLKSLN